jgi:hypothetical protein
LRLINSTSEDAVNHSAESGPSFGSGPDLNITFTREAGLFGYTDKAIGSSILGVTYELPLGIEKDSLESKVYLAGDESFIVAEIEVF